MEALIKFLCIYIFSAVVLFASESKIYLTPSEKKWLIDNPTLYVGVDYHWKPIEYKHKEKLVGYSVDLLKEIAQMLNVKIKNVEIKSFDALKQMINSREVHLFSGLIKTQKRAEYLRFSEHYLSLDTSVCTLKNKSFSSLHEMHSKSVAVVKGYALSEMIQRDYPYIELKEVNTTQEALELLKESKVDGYFDATQTLKFELLDNNLSNLLLKDIPSYKLELSLSTHKDEKILMQILQKALGAIEDHRKESLHKKWFLVEYSENKNLIVKILLLLGFLALFIYVYILKNQKYR